MDLGLDQLRLVLKSLRGPGEPLDPPMLVLQVVASLVGNSPVEHAASAKLLGRAESGDPVTIWRYVALTGGGLVAVNVAYAVQDEELDGSGGQGPTIDARLIPLREVTCCRVVGVERRSAAPEEWTTSWEIGVRDAKPVHPPVGRSRPDREAASVLGRAVADRLGPAAPPCSPNTCADSAREVLGIDR